MTRTAIISIVTAALLAACAAWTTSKSAAEPISQSDLGAPTGTAAASATQQMPEVKDAVDAFNKRDYEGALKLLKDAAKKNPDMDPPYVIMLRWFAQIKSSPGVRGTLERAVMETPNDPEPYIIMGNMAVQERRVTEAKLLYEKADSLMADWKGKRKAFLQPQIFSGLAMTCQARNDWAGAQKELEAWLKLDPKSTAALQQLAQCLLQQKNVEGALEKLKEASKIDPDLWMPETQVARFYAQSGDQKNARKWFVTALTAAPRDLKTRLAAAQWAWETGQLDEAQKQAKAASQIDPKSLQAKILCGVVALFLKNYSEAEVYFEAAHNQSPKEFAASNNLALALAEQNDDVKRERALEYAEANVKQYPKQAEAYSTYGWVLYKLKRLDEAENALRNSIQAAGNTLSAETAYYLARVLADRGGHDADARQLLENALKTTAPFAQRDEAKALLEKLKK